MFTDSALPATLTAIHLALAALRRHRAGRQTSAFSPFVLPSFLFALTPWIWPSAAGMIAAFAVHVGWFLACELIAPASAPRAATPRAPVAPRPAVLGPPVPPAAPSAARRRPAGFVTTSVLAVIDECTGVKTFRFARPDGFDFVAGQFIAIRVQIDGRPHVRCYSISSSPGTTGYLEISVRRQGTVSTMLHATLRTGSVVAINAPAGTFVYPAGDDRPLALIAGGVGITPLISMLRHGITADPTRPIVLLYSGRREDEVAFVGELRLIAERHPQVRIALTLTQSDAPTRWRTGRIDLAMVKQYVTHPEHTIFCICGPAAMIAEADRMLQGAGVPPGQVRSERFDTTAAATLLNPSASAATRPAVPAPETPNVSAHAITFAVSGRRVTASPSQTLLEAAEADGIPISSSCRSGVCQSCRTRIIEGDADCRSDVLDPDDRAAGFILPCVSWATQDCVLEA